MKHVLRTILTALGIALLPVAAASAQISNTGPGSTNIISDTSTTTCTGTSSNSATITNTTTQSGSSGTASVDGNTSSGGATSGAVGNSSSSSTSLQLTNNNPCAPAVTTTPVTPTPEEEGHVLGEAMTASATSPVVVASLPHTADNLGTANVAASITAAVSGLALVTYAVRAWFNRENV